MQLTSRISRLLQDGQERIPEHHMGPLDIYDAV